MQNALEIVNWKLINECTSNSNQLLSYFNQDQELKDRLALVKKASFNLISRLEVATSEICELQAEYLKVERKISLKVNELENAKFLKEIEELSQNILSSTDLFQSYENFNLIHKIVNNKKTFQRNYQFDVSELSINTNNGLMDTIDVCKKHIFLMWVDKIRTNIILYNRTEFQQIVSMTLLDSAQFERILLHTIYKFLSENQKDTLLHNLDTISNNLMMIHRDFPTFLNFVTLKNIVNREFFESFLIKFILEVPKCIQNLEISSNFCKSSIYFQNQEIPQKEFIIEVYINFIDDFKQIYLLACKYFIKESEDDVKYFIKLDDVYNEKFRNLIKSVLLMDFVSYLDLIVIFIEKSQESKVSIENNLQFFFIEFNDHLISELNSKNVDIDLIFNHSLFSNVVYFESFRRLFFGKIIEVIFHFNVLGRKGTGLL